MALATLPSHHYAAKWAADQIKTTEEITDLGIKYFSLPEGTEKEALLLELLCSFHGYTTKYLNMILRGHVPYYAGQINEDAKIFLQRFLPKGTVASKTTLLNACRSLHLAFKGMDAGEVYDVLIMCLLKAIQKWDPSYTDKVLKVVDAINERFSYRKQFTAFELNTHVGFNGTGILRLLSRHGFLETIPGEKAGKQSFRRSSGSWTPPASWFRGPVGLPYFVSNWFRYYLQQYMTSQMNQLESSGNVLQLDHRKPSSRYSDQKKGDLSIPSADGQLSDASGNTWLADVSLLQASLDLTQANLKWVESTCDPLFASLTRQERYLLYLLFVRELGWKEAASVLEIPLKQVKDLFLNMMESLKEQAGQPD